MALKVVYFVLLVLGIVTVMGALPKIKCQYKNGVPAGISYRGEKHACYASPDGVSICGALGFHLYEVEELETCYKCCPVITTTESKSIGSPKPTTAGTGNGKQDKTWIYITLAVVVAIVAVVLGLLYKKGCFNLRNNAPRNEGIGNPEDLQLAPLAVPVQISGGDDEDRPMNYVGAA